MRTVLLTGATDGVGLALARAWRARGERPWLHGRQTWAALDSKVFEGERYVQADLADPEAPGRIQRALAAAGVCALDLLVLNAASGWVGPIEGLEAQRARELLEVDLIAPLHLTHLLLPLLRRARGRIVFVSSITVSAAAPRYAHYAAAKAAAEGFFRSLALELAGEVEVQVLRLGAVRTNLHEKSGLARAEIPWERFPTPEAVATEIDRVLTGSASWRTLGVANRCLHGFGRWLPALADRLRGTGPSRGAVLRPARPRCAITGGAQGIGRALAVEFARAGYDLTLIDRDGRGLEEVRDALHAPRGAPEILAVELTEETAVAELARTLAARPALDVFVHNAGTSAVGSFGTIPWPDQRRVLELNLVAPLTLTPLLLAKGGLAYGASIVHVASLSCFVGYPGAAVYAATKDGLAHFARSLRAARRATGGHVLTVYPGPTRTEHARRFSPDNAREDRRMAPEALARRIVGACARRQRVLVPGLGNTAFALFGHCLPGLAGRLMRRTLYEKLARGARATSSPAR
jgi:short-subunit dehydrogenase